MFDMNQPAKRFGAWNNPHSVVTCTFARNRPLDPFINNFMKGSITDESTRLGLSVDGKESFTKFNNQILKSEGKELALLKHKCQSLTASLAAVKLDNSNLRKEKEALLGLNSDYISSLNVDSSFMQKFYEDRAQSIEKVIFPTELWESSQLEPKLK